MKGKNKSIVILFSELYETRVKQIVKTNQYCGPTIVTGFKFLLFFRRRNDNHTTVSGDEGQQK